MDKRIVTPEEFCEAFRSGVALCLTEPLTQQTTCWGDRLRDAADMPHRLRGVMLTDAPCYLSEIAQTLELAFLRDYWVLDAIFCDPDFFETRSPRPDPVEPVIVAFEYRKNPAEAQAALRKLSRIKVPLKVLITFPGTRDDAARALKDYANTLRVADADHTFSANHRHVVIFGYAGPNDLRFSYAIYEHGAFARWPRGGTHAGG